VSEANAQVWLTLLDALDGDLDALAALISTSGAFAADLGARPGDPGPIPEQLRARAEAALTRMAALQDAAQQAVDRVARELAAVESLATAGHTGTFDLTF
jgi:hypothetical protein